LQHIEKATDIIDSAKQELYLRLFPGAWAHLAESIERAVRRGVGVRFISMGPMELR